MSGGQTQKQNVKQTQNSSFAPYAPTQPLLSQIINSAGGIPLQNSLNSSQQAGLSGINSTANSVASQFNPQLSGLANFAFGGGGAGAGIPGLQGANATANNALSPYLGANFLDPNSNPYLAPALSGLQDQITQGVQSQFAGAGRYGAGGDETKALALGLSEGLSPVLMNQFNQNAGLQQNAISQGYNNAFNTNQAQEQAANDAFANMLQGSNVTNQLYNPYLTELQAGNQAASIPYQNLGYASGLISPIASLGGTSNAQGQSRGTTSLQNSPLQTGLSGSLGLLGLLSMGQSGGLMGGLGSQLGQWL